MVTIEEVATLIRSTFEQSGGKILEVTLIDCMAVTPTLISDSSS